MAPASGRPEDANREPQGIQSPRQRASGGRRSLVAPYAGAPAEAWGVSVGEKIGV